MTLTPAYNRDYKSKKALLVDWDSGKDFIINDFGNRYDNKPCNKDSFPIGTIVKFRFSNLRKVFTHINKDD
jgi:hypothetical protein